MAFDRYFFHFPGSSTVLEFHPNFNHVDEFNNNDTRQRTEGGHLNTYQTNGGYMRYSFALTYVTSSTRDTLSTAWRNTEAVNVIFQNNSGTDGYIESQINNQTEPFTIRSRLQFDRYSGNLNFNVKAEDTISGIKKGAFILDSATFGILDTNQLG